MPRGPLAALTPGRLRLWLALVFAALAVPAAFLVAHSYGQLRWEAREHYRALAREATARIDTRLRAWIAEEQARAFDAYGFLVVGGDPGAAFVRRSPLSTWPVRPSVPGLMGYFQIDAEGRFTTPLLPGGGTDLARHGIDGAERAGRRALERRLHRVLAENRLVEAGAPAAPGEAERAGETIKAGPSARRAAPAASRAEAPRAQAAFDRLSTAGRAPADGAPGASAPSEVRGPRGDAVAPEPGAESFAAAPLAGGMGDGSPTAPLESTPGAGAPDARRGAGDLAQAPEPLQEEPLRVALFDTEIDPFEVALLESGHLVLFRKVWRGGARSIQGALVAQRPFLEQAIGDPFRASAVARVADLQVRWQGRPLATVGGTGADPYLARAPEVDGAMLQRMRLSPPLGAMELAVHAERLPAGPGAGVLAWLSVALAAVLVGGFGLLYRLGLRQIALVRQQQDFVSAVSHELRTPLTSIRMYAEMLREGWVDDARRRDYYDTIGREAERLSRLVQNVLQLARMSRRELRLQPRVLGAAEVVEDLRRAVVAQVEAAGFTLRVDCPPEAAVAAIEADPDALTQIGVNLVDNALKFAARAERREIVLSCGLLRGGELALGVRDYGPGIPKGQAKRVFELFYRADGGLTRDTPGTGLGLGIVRELAAAMGGRTELVHHRPGVEVRAVFREKGDGGIIL